MRRGACAMAKFLPAALLLGGFAISSLSCTTVTALWATPTPTATPSPTPTATRTFTPTATSSPTPSPTPEGLLAAADRAEYLVILRYTKEAVRGRFQAIQAFLMDQGYQVEIDAGQSVVGDMDVILYGALSCGQAIDDLTVILDGRLDIHDLDRVRFSFGDASYEKKNIVIQIQSVGRFREDL
jgi:hypothetical protein